MANQSAIATILHGLTQWAKSQSDIQGILLVGSYAIGTHRPDSDVDLVLLVDDKEKFLTDLRWLENLNPTRSISREEWGVLTSLRVTLTSGLELEFGWVAPSWASTSPLDPGTERVVRDGAKILYDPRGLLAGLIRSINQ